MRRNRLIKFWPKIEPKMISYADKLVAENRELEPKQLLTEAFLGLKHICSTKKRIRDTVSLITSAKRYMRKSAITLINPKQIIKN